MPVSPCLSMLGDKAISQDSSSADIIQLAHTMATPPKDLRAWAQARPLTAGTVKILEENGCDSVAIITTMEASDVATLQHKQWVAMQPSGKKPTRKPGFGDCDTGAKMYVCMDFNKFKGSCQRPVSRYSHHCSVVGCAAAHPAICHPNLMDAKK